jgi:hypothetical protein
MVVHNPVDAFQVVLISVACPHISLYLLRKKAVVHNPVYSIFLALVHITAPHNFTSGIDYIDVAKSIVNPDHSSVGRLIFADL